MPISTVEIKYNFGTELNFGILRSLIAIKNRTRDDVLIRPQSYIENIIFIQNP